LETWYEEFAKLFKELATGNACPVLKVALGSYGRSLSLSSTTRVDQRFDEILVDQRGRDEAIQEIEAK